MDPFQTQPRRDLTLLHATSLVIGITIGTGIFLKSAVMAQAVGTPLLVLREKTERPEAIASGNARLVGTSTEMIVAETRRLIDNPPERAFMARPGFPFGNGRAGAQIASIVRQWLEQRPNLDQSLPSGTAYN